MVCTPDLTNIDEMHGTLIDSHRRSSLTIDRVGSESIVNSSISLDDSLKKQPNPTLLPNDEDQSSANHLKQLNEEDDEDEKEVLNTVVTHSADFFRWTHGHRRVMLTFVTICIFAFMTGVEYAVILPTAFDYVKTMTNVNIYVGLILSSYSISGSIAGVIMGKISDVTGKVKLLIIFSNVFEIGGNILYFATNNIHIVLLGRLIAGVGMGAVPPILADVAHRTTEKDRTKAIAIILGCRQLGLLIGPCFTLLVRMMNFHIGSIHVNNLNGPGFLMASIWSILQVVCWLCFYDRTPSTTTGPPTSADSPKHKYIRSDQPSRQDQKKISSSTYIRQYARVEMFVLFLATFIAYFNQTALETIVAAFTEKNFGWNTVHTSILFALAGLEIILVYLSLVFFLSKRFQDRFLLIFGFLSLTAACTLGTFFTWSFHSFGWSTRTMAGHVDRRLFVMFIIFVFLDLLGLPFLAATSVSLFTKLTIKELQGVSQGIQRLIMGIGTIIGPLFASFLLDRLHLMMTTMLILTSITLIALIFVIQRLRPLSEKNGTVESKDANNNLNPHSLRDEEAEQSIAPGTSKNSYVVLVQQDDEQNHSLLQRNSKTNSLKKLTTNNSDGNQRPAPNNHSPRFDTSSTNILCLSDDQQRTVVSKDFSSVPS